jgi:hypothetical protein
LQPSRKRTISRATSAGLSNMRIRRSVIQMQKPWLARFSQRSSSFPGRQANRPTGSRCEASHAASRHPPDAPSLPAATQDWQTGRQRKCKDSFAGGGSLRSDGWANVQLSTLNFQHSRNAVVCSLKVGR